MSDEQKKDHSSLILAENRGMTSRSANLVRRGIIHLSKKYVRTTLKFTELSWEDVEKICEPSWSGWNESGKRQWAKQAWQFIGHVGLTQYSNEIERVQVIIRLLALAGIYADFYELAFEDGFEPNPADWVQEFEISAFAVSQLAGKENPSNHIDIEDEEELVIEALRDLANEARREVIAPLFTGFRGVSGLFISLWKSNSNYAKSVDEEDDEIVNQDLTANKMRAFEWINENCYPR